jgi:hypothetical protein
MSTQGACGPHLRAAAVILLRSRVEDASWATLQAAEQQWAHVCLVLDAVRSNVTVHLMDHRARGRGVKGALGDVLVRVTHPLTKSLGFQIGLFC